MSRLEYFDFKAISEFFGQFTVRCAYYFFFLNIIQLWDRAQNMLIFV